jgi:murein DD-endopeptidase MepM/ murein hydrolase activator NlpD
MRAKMAAAFALGFAAGVLCLSVGLWWTGALGTTLRTEAAGAQGEGERETLGVAKTVHLAIPIAGVAVKDLTDTFNQARAGHKHEALDIPAPRGTPVMAAGEGNIVKLFTSKQGGLTVYQFDDSRTYSYYYAHLDRYAPGLREGTRLRRGEVLGYVGSTGNASPEAPHLHFAVFKLGPEKKWWEGTAIDPLPLFR